MVAEFGPISGSHRLLRFLYSQLMDVLMNEEHHGIISFLEHGNGFIIHKKRVFAAEVLPKYFKASKVRKSSRPVGPDSNCLIPLTRPFFYYCSVHELHAET